MEIVGHKRGMRNYEVVRALGDRAATSRSVQPKDPVQDPSIMRIRNGGRWHLVLYSGGRVYDPGLPGPSPDFETWKDYIVSKRGWRIVSVFPLTSTR